MKKKSIGVLSALFSLLFSVSSAWAELVVTATSVFDDFDRTANYGSTPTLGTNLWSSGTGEWGIVDGKAAVTTANAVAYNTALSTMSGSGYEFTLSAEIHLPVTNKYAGIVFNYQNASNYYTFRYKSGSGTYQVRRLVNGVDASVGNFTSSHIFGTNTAYILTVTSSEAYNFKVSIAAADNPMVLLVDNVMIQDANNSFTGGYAGLNQTSSATQGGFDNFRLEVIPEPATMGLLGLAMGVILLLRRIRHS